MAHLRFTPAEYRTLSLHCHLHNLGRTHQAAFRRQLIQSLRESDAALSAKVAGLGRARLGVLYWHFRERTSLAEGARPHFTQEELRLIRTACISPPVPVRLLRPFRGLLVVLFRREQPDLARKLTHLSEREFARLYEQVVCGQTEG